MPICIRSERLSQEPGAMGCFLDFINAIVHIPVIEDYIWYGFWFVVWLFAPLLCLLIFLYDVLSGHVWVLFHRSVPMGEAVFITGCDTGFGRKLAVRLAKRGLRVYAACLTDKAIFELRGEDKNISPLKMDVSKPEQVSQAAERVAYENPGGLYALYNNAGVARTGLIDWFDLNDFRFCMEVNFFGVVSVTKAFLPLIKKRKGRIINISSVAGVSCGYPLNSAYASSKHAVELFTSSLRQEMKPWGVKVVTINPGFHRTEMNNVAVETLRASWDRTPEEIRRQYGEDYIKGASKFVKAFTNDMAFNPVHVVNEMERALTARWPRVQYRVAIDSKYGLVWSQILPLRVGERIIYYLTTNWRMRRIVGLSKEEIQKAKTPRSVRGRTQRFSTPR